MKKTIIQGLTIISLFAFAWIVLTHINWVKVFKVKDVTDKTEQRIGELFLEYFQKTESEINNLKVTNPIDSIVDHICITNNFSRESIKVYILQNEEINAFALPNGYIILYSGLILNSDNQDELAGVICHEIAHIKLNHVIKKLIKEVGLSVIISMTTGESGREVIKNSAKLLSSTAFDRSLEKEADIQAVDYLLNAEINPEPFSNFLYKMSLTENEATKYLTWISTHPESRERAEYLVEYFKDKIFEFKPVISDSTFKILKEELQY